jgi:hypothetical protein
MHVHLHEFHSWSQRGDDPRFSRQSVNFCHVQYLVSGPDQGFRRFAGSERLEDFGERPACLLGRFGLHDESVGSFAVHLDLVRFIQV